MRGSPFSRFDRELIHYRAGPPRRTANGLSILFLLGLAVAAVTRPGPPNPRRACKPILRPGNSWSPLPSRKRWRENPERPISPFWG